MLGTVSVTKHFLYFSAIRHKSVQNIPKACYCCNSSSNFASKLVQAECSAMLA